MHPDTNHLLFTRRHIFAWAAGATALCSRVYAFAADFWNKKSPVDWSSDEVHLLLTKSPWAKQVTAEVTRAGGGGSRPSTGGNNSGMGSGGNSRGGMGGMGAPGGGGGGRGGAGGMGGGGNNSDMGGGGSAPRAAGQQFKGIVRWESAKPVLEASKGALPDTLSNHYVIGVINFPLGGRRADSEDGGAQPKLSNSALERIKAATSLTPKGKDAVHPAVALVMGNGLLLGFPKDSVKLSADDKEVAFSTAIGRMPIKTKFNFKEMTYHETLAI